MNFFGGIAYLYNIVFYQPLFNALILLYMYIPGKDFGVAVILLTVLIRLLLYPLMAESIRVQKITSDLQPKIKEIKEKYKNDKEKQAMMQLDLLKNNNVNLFNGFFVSFIQLPILIALYQAFSNGLKEGAANQLYSFVGHLGSVDPLFLNFIDLSEPSPFLVLAAGLLQFFQSKMFYINPAKSSDSSQMMQKQMLYFMPVMTVVLFWSFPAALSLYLAVSSVCAIVQQKIIFNKLPSQPAGLTNFNPAKNI